MPQYKYQVDENGMAKNLSFVSPGETLDESWLTGTGDALPEIDSLNQDPYKTNSEINTQIIALESKQTLRRMRDAIAGTDGGWLADLEAQIAVLRAQRK